MIKEVDKISGQINFTDAVLALLIYNSAKLDLLAEKVFKMDLLLNHKDDLTDDLIESELQKVDSDFISKQYDLLAELESKFRKVENDAKQVPDLQSKINEVLSLLISLVPEVAKTLPKADEQNKPD